MFFWGAASIGDLFKFPNPVDENVNRILTAMVRPFSLDAFLSFLCSII